MNSWGREPDQCGLESKRGRGGSFEEFCVKVWKNYSVYEGSCFFFFFKVGKEHVSIIMVMIK